MQTNRCNESDNDIVYKDVVIVGNGPSGISLSYMLAGNWPYYNREPHPNDEMLTARLHYTFNNQTCPNECREDDLNNTRCCNSSSDEIEEVRKSNKKCCSGSQKKWKKEICLGHISRDTLECLSAGVEGRTGGRPLSLLMDQLQHPGVDIGMDVPSLISWKFAVHEPDHRIIDHVVLGKGPPGGAWHSLDPNVLTISLSRWMSLPNLDLRLWEQLEEAEKQQHCCAYNMDQEKTNASRAASRVPIGTVAAYFQDYVVRQGLQQYFRCGVTVTSVQPVVGVSLDDDKEYGWQVEGFENESMKRFRYRCKRVILATGTTDSSNRLGIPGEDTQNSWVTHDLSDLENKLDEHLKLQSSSSVVRSSEKRKSPKSEPILVVGAGLSAADAIMASRFRGIPVLHTFRDASIDLDEVKKSNNSGAIRLQYLPDSVYPEYYKVYEMMADGGRNYPLYKALPNYSLVSLTVDTSKNGKTEKRVVLCSPNGQLASFKVSLVAILIGSKPDLSYMESKGFGLGKNPNKYIDSKSNPIVVDDITYEVLNSPRKGLYALGPLAGDNFVRFILGGAFGVFRHILNSNT